MRDSLSLGGNTPRAPQDRWDHDPEDQRDGDQDPFMKDAALLNGNESPPPPQWPKRGASTSVMLFFIVLLLATIAVISRGPQIDPNWTAESDVGHSHGGGGHDEHHEDGPMPEADHPHDEHDDDVHPDMIEVDHHEDDEHPHHGDEQPDLDERYLLDPSWDFGAPPQRREFHWTIADQEFNPDGVFRPMMLINGQFPGPMIEVNEDDTVVVHVDNQAANATSLHWHGIYQNGTNFMDGTVGITQCPIAPGSTFTYEFTVRDQAGSYWYHGGHLGVQASDGLYGPLIIHGREERIPEMRAYASDRVVMLSDHYYDTGSALLMKYLASDRENVEPVPDAALINGRGIRDCSKVPHRKCDSTSAHVGQPRLNLESRKSHRIRLINTGAFAEFQVAIDEHMFDMVEVDGTEVHPATFGRLTINPAQRYSIIVNATNDAQSLSWLRAKMLTFCFGEENAELEAEAFGVIEYHSGTKRPNIGLPSSAEWDPAVDAECRDMNTSSLVPVEVMAAPSRVDGRFYLRSNFEIGDWRLSRGFFNQSSFRPNLQAPSLFRSIDGLSSKNFSFTGKQQEPAYINSAAFHLRDEMVIQTEGIAVVDLLVSNFDDGNHPLHLHGYKYFVLAQGHGYPPENLTETVDLSNPLRRDTASVEAFGWILLRVVADNPGAWSFHCHVSWHSEAGLVMQLLTRTDELSKMRIPEANRALCDAPLQELQKGARPPDEIWFGNFEVPQDG